MRTRMLAAATAALGLMAIPGCEREEGGRTSGSSSNPDRAFMIAADQANLAEVAAGRLAMDKGSNEEVKQFGHHMVEDHTRANEELTALARKKGVALPGETDDAQKKEAARLGKLSGADFDRAYAEAMVKDHVRAVALFEDKAKTAQDPEVRAFAEKLAPKLRDHLKMARDLSAKVGAQP